MAPSNPGSPAGAGGGRPQSPSVSGSNSNSSSNGAGKGKGILTASTPASSSEGNTLASINPVDPLGRAAAPHGSGSSSEGAAGSAPVSAPSTVALHQLVTGCKVFVERPAPEEPRKAEILSIRQRKPPRPPRNKDGTLARPPPEEAPKPILEYYIHYVEFNKVRWVLLLRELLGTN